MSLSFTKATYLFKKVENTKVTFAQQNESILKMSKI